MGTMGRAFWLPPFLALFGMACSEDEPTFATEVAPILKENCVTCHQPGGIAPFALTDYDSAKSHARAIADATERREMPPMPVNNDGSCNTYSNARWLTNEEIETLAAWADAGAPEGDDSTADRATPSVTLDDPDAVLELGAEYLPNDERRDDYRCFVLPAPVAERAFMTRYEVVPGDPRVVHHAILYQPDSDEAVVDAHARDDAEPGDGYTCFGGPGVSASPIALWAPGAGIVETPTGTGVPIEANRELVFQIHYNLEHGTHPDRTSVKLDLVDGGVVTGIFAPVANLEMMLPPGRDARRDDRARRVRSRTSRSRCTARCHTCTRSGGPCASKPKRAVRRIAWLTSIVGIFTGKTPGGTITPLDLDAVSSLSIRCGYDTSTRSEITTWGEGTADEMCISYFYLTIPEPDFSCTNEENPVLGSCMDELLEGCYTPDVSGTCMPTDDGIVWSDGSRYVGSGTNAGFYGPGDEEPCISVGYRGRRHDPSRKRRARTGAICSRRTGARFSCPDGSTFEATTFHVNEFGTCRGIGCPPE